MSHCCVPGCKVRRKAGVPVYMARFPTGSKNPTLKDQWIANIAKYSPKEIWEPRDNDVVCENHFRSDQWENIRVDGVRKLKRYSAVPTLFLGLNIKNDYKKVDDEVLQAGDKEVPQNDNDSNVGESYQKSKTDFSHNFTSKIVQSPIVLNLDDCNDMCRTCGDHGDFLSIYEQNTENLTFADIIMECMSIQISRKDGLPEKICPKCVALIIEICAFKRRCEALDQLFHSAGMESKDVNVFELQTQEKCEILEEFDNVITTDPLYDSSLETLSHPILETELRPLKPPSVFKSVWPKVSEITNESVANLERLKRAECHICHKSMNSNYLNRHMQSHSEKKYICDICGKEFSRPNYLVKHMVVHKDDYPFQCNTCERKFKRFDSLREHLRVHTGERPFTCEYCQKSFVRLKNLKMHIRIHTGEKRYGCNICGRRFIQSTACKSHQMTHISPEGTGKIIIRGPRSKKVPINRENLNPEDYPFKCDKCEKRYETRQLLRQHNHYNHNKNNYLCSDCGKVFKNRSELNIHSTVHTGIKAYACTLCSKKFGIKGGLRRHMRIHTGEKPYECNVCKRKFRQSNTMKTHMKIHSNIKPYKCVICEKAFSFKASLSKHRQTHVVGYSCPVWDKGFYD